MDKPDVLHTFVSENYNPPLFVMSKIVTRRDYLLTRFRIEAFLQKGFENLSDKEETELRELSREMMAYEQAHFPVPDRTEMTGAKKPQ